MNAETGDPAGDEFMQTLGMGMFRIKWAQNLLAQIEAEPESATEEFMDSLGVVRNDAGLNLYHFMVTRCLYSATRCLQSVAPLQNAGVGSVPTEVLLRSALVASAKALFLLMPEKRGKRERRMEQVYASDRGALDYATKAELKLVGESEPSDSEGRKKPGLDDSKIIRDVLDDLVAKGSCPCGDDDCPRDDLAPLRHRVLRLWWLYSSVAHVNIWHLEKAATVSQSGETTTTGDLSQAIYDIGWLYARAVIYYAERNEMLLEDDFENLQAGLEQMSKADFDPPE